MNTALIPVNRNATLVVASHLNTLRKNCIVKYCLITQIKIKNQIVSLWQRNEILEIFALRSSQKAVWLNTDVVTTEPQFTSVTIQYIRTHGVSNIYCGSVLLLNNGVRYAEWVNLSSSRRLQESVGRRLKSGLGVSRENSLQLLPSSLIFQILQVTKHERRQERSLRLIVRGK